MKIWKFLTVAGIALVFQGIQAQAIVNQWTYAGGGLDPETYGDDYRPSTLIPDTAYSNGGTIGMLNFTSGGLGSDVYGAYGGIYTFFSDDASFTLNVGSILDEVDQVIISIIAGGGEPTPINYDASSLTLNYNLSYSSVASSSFTETDLGTVPTPAGNQNLIEYKWTWTNLSSYGPTTGFSTAWDANGLHHVFYSSISVAQAIPEPSMVGLLLLAGLFFILVVLPRKSALRRCREFVNQ